jgi:hypothetical protein
MIAIFRPVNKNHANIAYIIQKENFQLSGDVESMFFDQMTVVETFPDSTELGNVMEHILGKLDISYCLIIRNLKIVLDANLPQRLIETISSLDVLKEKWMLCASGGMGVLNERYSAMYSSFEPAIPYGYKIRPIVDIHPDIYVVNMASIRNVFTSLISTPNTAFELIIIIEGYLNGLISIFCPILGIGINGNYLRRDKYVISEELITYFNDRLPGQFIETLLGSIEVPNKLLSSHIERGQISHRSSLLTRKKLTKEISYTVLNYCSNLSISIVTRTQFKRLHLLNRLLTSISRSRLDDMNLEIILSTDAKPKFFGQIVKQLKEAFVNLNIKVAQSDSLGHSRVTNLSTGIRAASNDYVMILDDDDYIDLFAFQNIRLANFLNEKPIIIGASEVHEEKWIDGANGTYILAESKHTQNYYPHNWKTMFSGINALPICSIVTPRDSLLERLSIANLRYDLSEDYTLFLLLLTNPNLPEIFELPFTISHISIRPAGENSVTTIDRTKWTHDISGFLYDLIRSDAASDGMWKMFTRHVDSDNNIFNGEHMDILKEKVNQKNKEISLLKRQILALRSLKNNGYEGDL